MCTNYVCDNNNNNNDNNNETNIVQDVHFSCCCCQFAPVFYDLILRALIIAITMNHIKIFKPSEVSDESD